MAETDVASELGRLKDRLLDRVPNAEGVGCELCAWILTDLARHGTLTGKVPDPCYDSKPVFPVEGKLRHIWIEGFWTEGLKQIFVVKT